MKTLCVSIYEYILNIKHNDVLEKNIPVIPNIRSAAEGRSSSKIITKSGTSKR